MAKKPEITFTLTIEPEDIDVRGNFDSGDAVADRKLEDEILARLERNDLWAWCYVKVTATVAFKGESFAGFAGLGGCSYSGEKEFTQAGGYYEDLCKEARADLLKSVENAHKRGNVASELWKRLK